MVASLVLSILVTTTVQADEYDLPLNGSCKTGDTPVTVDNVPKCRTPVAPPGGGSVDKVNADDETTCAIDKIGWILCPLIEKAGQAGDQAFQLLSKNFLETDPELVSSGETGTYVAWKLARNIANIMFIAAFLIIILSQVTGRGLNNYGIKKLLPKLIIAAITVNISYYICQLMVDLTNILGYEIQNLMVDMAAQISTNAVLPVNTGFTSTKTEGGALGMMAGAILSLAAIVWFLLPVLFLGVSTVVITCLVIIAILLMRKAFIVLLVVISPIAFVMYLLPNTEKYFQKWLSMFWQLLLVFPVVSLLFGAGQLASAIILKAGTSQTTDTKVSFVSSSNSLYSDNGGKCIELPKAQPNGAATNSNNTTSGVKNGAENGNPATIKPCDDGSTPLMLGLVAAGIAVAPMLAVWSVLKGALSAAGAIGGKISGQIQSAGNGLNKYARKPEDAARNFARKRAGENASGAWDRMQGRGLEALKRGGGDRLTRAAGRYAERDAARKERLATSKSELERAKKVAVDDMLRDPDTRAIITGGLSNTGVDRTVRSADASHEKVQAEEMQAASLHVRNMNDDQVRAIADRDNIDVNDPQVAAAIDELGKRQDFRSLERIMNRISEGGTNLSTRTLASTVSQNIPELLTSSQVSALSRGAFSQAFDGRETTYNEAVNGNVENGILSAEKAAVAGPSVLNEISSQATSQLARQNIAKAATDAFADPILSAKISRNRNVLTEMSYIDVMPR